MRKKGMKITRPAEDKHQFPISKYLLLFTIFFASLVLGSILSPSWLEYTWPYLLMSGATLLIIILDCIKAPKLLIGFVGLTTIIALAGAIFLFYYAIPQHRGYVPLTDELTGSQHFTIYQLQGKIQLFYSPDYPIQGDMITGYISLCSNDYSECIDINSYELNASFTDDVGTQHTILSNQKLGNRTPFKIEYPGRPVDVYMKIGNSTLYFRLPKESWLQTLQIDVKRHPFLGSMLILGSIMSLVTIVSIAHIKSFGKKLKKTYSVQYQKMFQSSNTAKRKRSKGKKR